MMTLIVIGLLFGAYKIGSAAAKNPGATAGAGKFLLGLFRK